MPTGPLEITNLYWMISHSTRVYSLDKNANPEEEEEGSEAHEHRGHGGYYELLLQLPCKLGRGHLLINTCILPI